MSLDGHQPRKLLRLEVRNAQTPIDVVSTTLTANPGAKRWVFFSCNDDGVLGGVRATENAGMDPKTVIGIGIDGSRSCEAFGAGKATGFRGTMWLDSAKHGAAAPYARWSHCIKEGEVSGSVYPTGVGGVLYPPGSLDALVTGESAFDDLPDVMRRLADTPGDTLCHRIRYV